MKILPILNVISTNFKVTMNFVFTRTCCNSGCDAAILDETIESVVVGAGLRLHGQCAMGHKSTWKSCEFLNKGRTSILDVMISTFQLTIGINMTQVKSEPPPPFAEKNVIRTGTGAGVVSL
jgi:hypothetical protein